ncbi:LytR C-terminal domain-containing protein [Candidatus Gottesmanbacteria bacterium]|nr:LytR C-terminal domain-containing protein [Candidatus Gottesmanbacteria bacterium]
MRRRLPQKKKSKKLLWLLIFIFILIILGVIWWPDIWGSRRWDGQRRFNIVYSTDPVVLVSFEGEEEEATVVVVPESSYMRVPRGYGTYKAESVYDLGELDSKVGGGLLISETVQSVFGVPIDGYIKLEEKSLGGGNIDYQRLKSKLFNLKIISKVTEGKTNLTLPEVIRFYLGMNRLRSDQVDIIDLEKANILDDIKLPDSSVVGQIDSDRLDKQLAGAFAEKEMLKENLSIAIENGTSVGGVAGQIARLIGNMGGKVVDIGNTEGKEEGRCKIMSNVDTTTYTVKRLAQVFRCVTDKKADEGISDISIILGREFIE